MADKPDNAGLLIKREYIGIVITLTGILASNIVGWVWWAAKSEARFTTMDDRQTRFESAFREQGEAVTAQLSGMSTQLAKLQDVVYEVRAAQRVTDSSMGDVRRRLDAAEARR